MAEEPSSQVTVEEKIGRQIVDKYRLQTSSGPIMIPPIPDSKFFEKFPDVESEDQVASFKELQDSYEAEVKVFRCFEALKRNVIVIHQLEYTHQQYSTLVSHHNCNKKKCKKGPHVHPCHQPDRNIDGETDFVVIGPDFVAVFEVKGLAVSQYQTSCSELISKRSIQRNGIILSAQERNAVQFEGCCEDAARQRNRMVDLVKHLNSSIEVYQFTIFPKISKEEVNEGYLYNTTFLFSGDLENFASWFDANIPSSVSHLDDIMSLRCSLLGLWCINKDNKWDTNDCSLSKGIKDIDTKLSRALITQKSVDQESLNLGLKCKGKRRKIYPENAEIVEAPKIFKDYLNISCLTQEQLDVFNCEERFMWVEGPAGSGKTITILGKSIDILLRTQTHDRVLIVTNGSWMKSPVLHRYNEVLNSIRNDIECTTITHELCQVEGHKVRDEDALASRLTNCNSKIVLLKMSGALTSCGLYDAISSFKHVFVDDYQGLSDCLLFDTARPHNYTSNIVCGGLLPILKNSATNETALWVFCDHGQSMFQRSLHPSRKTLYEFRKIFPSHKFLSVNLRNTYEISAVLSVIREHYNRMEYSLGPFIYEELPQQKNGHFLRGTKPNIYLLREDNPAEWKGILVKELCKLWGPDSSLENKDIAILYSEHIKHREKFLASMMEKKGSKIDIIEHSGGICISAEWPAVIALLRYEALDYNTYINSFLDNTEREKTLSFVIPILYLILSRGRVYSSIIIFNYQPNTCIQTDKMLSELKERQDVCRIIELF